MAGRTNKIKALTSRKSKSISMPNNDFLKPLLDLMQKNAERQDERMNELNNKIEKNTELTHKVHNQTLKTNGRVNTHDEELQELKKMVSDLHPPGIKKANLEPWYKDPLILKIIVYVLLLGIIIAGAVLGINVKDYL